jgi:hypothetical protein
VEVVSRESLLRPQRSALSPSEIIHVGVRTQSGVVREIPADVVRIVVNHDRIAIPQPAIDEAVVPRRDAEVEAIEPEPVSVPSLEPEHMAGTEPTRETPVRKGMIEVIVRITPAGIVSDPRAVGVNVGRVWMPWLVAKVANSSVLRRAASRRSRTALWNEATAEAMHTATTVLAASALRKGGDNTHQRER